MSVPKASLKLDGNMLATVVPSVIMGSRTLVPIRFIESLGAQVGWDNATQTATVEHNATIVSMRINSDTVTVNGQNMKLDENSIPKLVTFTNLKDSRTMVPVRFVSQVLGYSVNWDPASYTALIDSPAPPAPAGNATITGIEAIKGSTGKYRIKITSNMPLKYEHIYMDSSGKLVLDFPDARINIPGRLDTPGDMSLDDELITRVQYSQFTIPPNPYTARVVLTLNKNAQFSFVTADEGKTSYISFDENQVSGIYMDREDGRDLLMVEGVTSAKYNIIELSNPTRVVIDIMDASLNGQQYQTFDYNLGFVKSVRASQFVADKNYSSNDRIVRVVLDVKNGIENPKVLIVSSENGLQIFPEEDMWAAFSYVNFGNQAKLSFKHLDEVEAELDYDEVRKELKIEIPTRDTELPEGSFIIKDNLVNEVTVDRGRTRTEITVSFRRSVGIEVLSEDEDEILEILAVRNDNISPGERTIVIDAGHGGKDPGAISLNGFHEKEINLTMATQLQQKLVEQGYNVIMTRTDDTFVDLYSRPRLANEMNADLFISMHANSNIKSSITGLEVLYCPATSSELKLEDQFPFADRIYASILNSTRTPGRGVFKRSELVVLRETIMPAVLIEIGYLSNSQEESMVRDPRYQASVVQGIVDGVNQYLSEY
jgi:N-acetylmuramoyl-L-alanine amidase